MKGAIMPDSPPIPIFDGHNDTLSWLNRHPTVSFFDDNESNHIDFPRAQRGQMQGGLFAIFAPDPNNVIERQVRFTGDGYAVPLSPAYDAAAVRAFTALLLDELDSLVAASGGRLHIVRTAAELLAAFIPGHLAIALHFEGAEAIDADLTLLPGYYQRGLRSLGLVWSRPNVFAEGVPFMYPASPDTGPGLTAAGRELVQACERMGILLDLAHLNERGFWDVAAITGRPLVVTHTGVHTICAVSRNLTDRQIDAIGASGGVIGIAYDVSMIRHDGGLDPATPLAAIADHICYVADRIGIEHVALGSDFDGSTIATSIGDVTGVPALLAELQTRGFDDVALNLVANGNWLRVLQQAWHGEDDSSVG